MARDFGFPPEERQPYYFISYHSQDAARVSAVCREMNRRGVPMWYDRGLLSGEKWEKQITTHIRYCHEMILFVTKKLMARENPYVYTEFAIAKKFNKRIHIVMLNEILFEDVSDDLKGWFVSMETLHGVYPQADSSPVQIVDAMENLIGLIKRQPDMEVHPASLPEREKTVSIPVSKKKSNTVGLNHSYSAQAVPGINKTDGSIGNGIMGAILGALVGFILYLYLYHILFDFSFIDNNTNNIVLFHFITFIPSGMLSVALYSVMNGVRSKPKGLAVCIAVNGIVSSLFVLSSYTPMPWQIVLSGICVGCLSMTGLINHDRIRFNSEDSSNHLMNDSLGKGVLGAALGAFLGGIPFFLLLYFLDDYIPLLCLPIGLLASVFYTYLNGKRSVKTQILICLSFCLIAFLMSINCFVFQYFSYFAYFIEENTQQYEREISLVSALFCLIAGVILSIPLMRKNTDSAN